MSVRLAFAVAAHLEPDILLVDEVLAVGDAAFQRKSLGKMNEVARDGRTVIFVSHNLAIIQALCRRAVLLERGVLVLTRPSLRRSTLPPNPRARRRRRSARADGPRRSRLARCADIASRDSRRERAGGRGRHRTPAIIRVHVTDVLPMMDCRLTIVKGSASP